MEINFYKLYFNTSDFTQNCYKIMFLLTYFSTVYFIPESTMYLPLRFIYYVIQFQDRTINNTTKMPLYRAYI